ncbi:GNS1/SUR4 family-domain-containing protein [Stachybotrys elegans]|uniref:Elongation of fatty acids protein n=1 Tax=Stachybotrys elegans TaxID=80388 RepID=A0A8K0WXH2_9HYPO|nr:GNS1/SUR4 family-domain-containing protein [Stachybotrys elegans]
MTDYLKFPDSRLMSWPPVGVPDVLAPSPQPLSIMHPVNIPEKLFVAALDPLVPLGIAGVYTVIVKTLSAYNRANGKKPWAISKTRIFNAFVVLHNIFLAVYSAWTFVAMVGVMRRSIYSPFGPDGWAGTADSFCRIQGPPGLGNSIYYNDTAGHWDSLSTEAQVTLENGLPSSTQPGRLWNEGLAYYGWIFYLSKFYEVIDTLIILAKGKPSSTLQTYHHAGAMMCMWAAMRYMSAPGWIFAYFNSFIHSLMYTYYTVTAFGVKVPLFMKRSLTTLQITQFFLGGGGAFVHTFIHYIVPMTVVTSKASPPAEPATTSILSAAADALDMLQQQLRGVPSDAGIETQNTLQPCIVTPGETFAIWLNVIYLTPLTYLFMSFFVSSYVKRSNAEKKKLGGKNAAPQLNVTLAEKAGWDAAKDVSKVYNGESEAKGKSEKN